MNKKSSSQSAFFNFRVLLFLCAIGALLVLATLGALPGGRATGPQQSPSAPARSQTTATELATDQAPTASAKDDRRASAIAATKVSGPRATEIFNLATTRAAEAAQSELPNEATLTTDQEDYQPYTYVYITGTGFTPGETVNMIVVQSAPNPASYEPWDVVADANGNIETSWYVFSEDLIGATMQVTATGQTSGLTASANFTDAATPRGVAPVSPPTGGFAIDGDLLSNTPTDCSAFPSPAPSPCPFGANQGDWYAGAGGTGGNVLNSDATGTPVNTSTTYHLVDLFNSANDDNFAGGDKVDDNPSTWNWTLNPVGAKQDLNNGLIHIIKDPITQHTWVVMAADRFSNNGDAYIDFEFLQNSLTTTPLVGSTGGFSSAGPNCGRTVNDFLLTLQLTKGGSVPGFFVSRWVAASGNHSCTGTSYDYIDATTPVVTATPPAVFAAVNDFNVTVPNNTAFGTNTYLTNTFAEAAVDLTALLGSFDPCVTVGIKTILIKTKESQSPTANIVDFIVPQQIVPALVIGPTVDAGPDQSKCEGPGGTTSFTLAGSAQPGTYPITSTTWSCVSSCTGVAIASPSTLSTGVTISGSPRTVTLRLTVTDSGTCGNHIRSDDVILTVNNITASSSNTPILCHGGTSTVTVSASGGATPYNGTGTFTRSAGTYSFTVTDANSCTATTTINVTEPPLLTASSSNTAILCHGGSSTVTVTAGGGTAPYSGTQSFTHGAGTYSVTVTDSNGCTATTTGNITEPNTLTASSSNTAILCHGGSSTVTVTAGGGTAPYSGTQSFTHGAGTYSVTVTDSNGCTATTTGNITEPNTLTASSSNTAILCHGGSSTVTVTAGGGTAPYSGTQSFTHGAGTYSVTVTDSNGCTATTTGNITEPPLLTASSSNTAILCHGGSSTVTVTAGGGTAPYSGTQSFTHGAGTYSVTVTDSNGCTATTTGNITEPPLLTASSSNTAILCHGGSSTVTVTAGGGTAPYSGTQSFTHGAGTYSVTVTDSNGCTATTTGNITEPPLLTASSSNTAILCHGGSSTVTVTAGGGTAPYSGTQSFTHGAGTYSVTVTDSNGCTATTTGDITEPPLLTASSSNTAILCHGGSSTVTVTAGGGTAPYSGTQSFTHGAGTYSVTVTDSNGCTATTTGNITEPPLLTASSSNTAILCHGGSSTVTVTAGGGTAPYSGTQSFTHGAGTYSVTVTDSNGCTATTTGDITEPALLTASSSNTAILCHGGSSTVTVTAGGGTAPYSGTQSFTHGAGTYSVTVTDSNGCTATTTGDITEPALLTASSSNTAILCHGGSSTVTVTAGGGTAPYSGTQSFTHGAGTYSVTVTDSNGCTATTTGDITEPALLTASSSNTAILCQGGSSTVTVTAGGGTPPYSGTESFTHGAGTYSVTVTDSNGCTATTTGDITEPDTLVASNTHGTISCFGGTTSVTISATGGTGPYTGTGTFTGVGAGSYTYTVTDANGCTSDTTVTLTEPDTLTASSSNTAILCHGGSSTVTVTAGGGTPPYSGTQSFTHGAGTYSVTVTDSNGCTATTTGNITEPPLLTASSSNTRILCNGGSSTVTVTAGGGTPPYSGTQSFTHGAGTYSVTVTDSNGCTATTTGNITQPSTLSASSSNTRILCNGGTSTVTVSATGGTPPYTGTGTASRSAGTYSYTVTDSNGCMATTTGNITQPSTLSASSSNTRILCNGGSSTVTVSATGGTTPYQGTGTFSRSAGTYSFTVTDANSCTATTTGNITQPSALTLSLQPGLCSAGNNGTITATFGGGTPTYQIKVDNGAYAAATSPRTITGLAPGSHTVTVKDANGCTQSSSISVASCPRFCALTQGAYGNAGGKYTYNGTKLGTTALLQQLVPAGNPLVVGVVGTRSLTITNLGVTCLDGDNSCHLARLPGNTGPTSLPSNFGDKQLTGCGTSCQTSPAIPLQGNGQWQSTLLGQTVTLTLNTRLDPTLPNLVLPSCVSIPASVVTALNNSTCNGGYGPTVSGLLNLANRALAGQSTCSASLGDINSAIDSINRQFDSSGNNNCPSCQQ